MPNSQIPPRSSWPYLQPLPSSASRFSCLTVGSDCGSALVAGRSTLSTHHRMGVPNALDSTHTTALRAIGQVHMQTRPYTNLQGGALDLGAEGSLVFSMKDMC